MSQARIVEIALIQRGPAGPDLDENLRENLRLIDEAGEKSPDFICLNELSTTPYFPRNPKADYTSHALPLDSKAIQEVCKRAQHLRCYIVYPFYEILSDSGETLNSVILISPEGNLVQGHLPDGRETGRFSKTHLASTPKTNVDEHDFFSPGEGFPVFDTPQARVGLLVCYDRRFPEGWRTLALQGAEIIFMVADVPDWVPSPTATAEEMFHIELRTRALENLFFVAGCNKAGIEHIGDVETRFFGRSCIINPYGGLLAEAPPDEPTILYATLDLGQINEARGNLPYFDERRPELYRLISERKPG